MTTVAVKSDLPPASPQPVQGGVATRTRDEDFVPRSENLANVLTFGAPAVLAGMVDTFGTSLGVIEDGAVDNWVAGAGNFGDFYQRNKEAIKTTADLTGMIVPGMLAAKAVTAVAPLARGMVTGSGLSARLVNTVFGNAAGADRALRLANVQTSRLAAKGVLDLNRNVRRQRLLRQAKNARTGDIIRDNVAAEIGILASMNNSDVLFPTDQSMIESIALNTVFGAGVVTPFVAGARSRITNVARRHAQSVAQTATAVRNPEGLPLDKVMSRPGFRYFKLANDSLARQGAKEMMDESFDTTVRSNFNKDVVTFETEMKDTIEKLGTDSYWPKFTKPYKLRPQQTANALDAERKNPGIMLGTISIQDMPESRRAMVGITQRQAAQIKSLNKEMNKLKDAGKLEEANLVQAKMTDLASAEFHVLDFDGTLVPAIERSTLYQDLDVAARTSRLLPESTVLGQPGFRSRTLNVPAHDGTPGFNAFMSEDGVVEISPAIDLSKTTTFHASAMYKLAQDTADNYKLGVEGRRILVPKDANLFQLDYVSELYARHGESILDEIVFDGRRLTSIDEVTFAGLEKKYTQYNALRDTIDKNLAKAGKESPINALDISRRLNLAVAPSGDTPVLLGFEQLRMQGDKKLKDAVGNLENFKRILQEDANFPDMDPFQPRTLEEFRGQMMNMPKDMEPSLLIKRPVETDVGLAGTIHRGFEAQRSIVLNMLDKADTEGADLVKMLSDELVKGDAAGAARVAADTGQLIEGGRRGRLAANIATQPMAVGETPAMQAINQVEEITDKLYRAEIGRLFEPHNQAFAEILLAKNAGHRESFNLYVNMRRQGWDLKEGTFKNADGLHHFILDDTASNQKRFSKLYGRPMEEGELAPAAAARGEYKPLAVTDMASDVAKRVDKLDDIYRRNQNVLAKAYSRKGVAKKAWHVPPKNFANKPAVVVLTPGGSVKTVVDGRTIADATKKANEIIRASDPKEGLIIADYADARRYNAVIDEPWEKMADFSDTLNQTGRSKGTSVSNVVVESGPGVLRDIIESQQSHFQSILRRTRETFFEPQLGYNRQMLGRVADSPDLRRGETVWQQYNRAVTGSNALNPNDDVSKGYFAIESIYDNTLDAVWDKLGASKDRMFSLPKSHKHPDKLNKQITEQIGEFNPFNDAVDFATRTHNVSPPPSMRKHMANLSWFSSLLTLRLADIAHPILTVTGQFATMPGVVRSLKRTAGESREVWKARIAAYGTHLDDVTDDAIFEPSRALMSGFHTMFTPEGRGVWQRAGDKGYIAQTVAETFSTITAPRGDAVSKIEKWLDKTKLTWLSDKTEDFTRAWAFMSGYNIAKRGLKMQSESELMTFAHRFANETIGNYNPQAKPRIFQGAVGMPLGLFHTFMWNYYQRIFGYIENSQTRALVTQFATQAAVFGGASVPGYEQFSDLMGSVYDGKRNPIDASREILGEDATRWLTYGALSNMSGAALYKRGDVNVRTIPTVFNIEDTPNFRVIKNSFDGLSQAVKLLRLQGGLSTQQIGEILSVYGTNRTLRLMGELSAGGQLTDRRGQAVGEQQGLAQIHRDVGVIAKMVGLRPLGEAVQQDTFYRVRATEASQKARLATLRLGVRSDIRAGNLTDEKLQDHLASYVRFGGRPEYFGRWIRDQFLGAKVDRAKLKLVEKMKKDPTGRDSLRLMSAFQIGLPGQDAELSDLAMPLNSVQ